MRTFKTLAQAQILLGRGSFTDNMSFVPWETSLDIYAKAKREGNKAEGVLKRLNAKSARTSAKRLKE